MEPVAPSLPQPSLSAVGRAQVNACSPQPTTPVTGFTRTPQYRRPRGVTAVVTPCRFGPLVIISLKPPTPRCLFSFGPSLHRAFPSFLATMASADSPPTLINEVSPGKVRVLSQRAARLYRLRFNSPRASLFLASSPSASRPHCLFVFLRSSVCLPLLSANTVPWRLPCGSATVGAVPSGNDFHVASTRPC